MTIGMMAADHKINHPLRRTAVGVFVNGLFCLRDRVEDRCLGLYADHAAAALFVRLAGQGHFLSAAAHRHEG